MGKMAEMQRKVLETMMGPEAMGVTVIKLDWWDDRVCRNYLFGTCPHLIFGNTKMDLGPCPKTHSEKILKEFQDYKEKNPNDPRVNAFRQGHEAALFGFVDDCDRRIRASQRKLEKTPEENRKTVDLMKEIGEIELSIQGGTEEMEALGEAGKIDESMEKLAAVDALRGLKTEKEKELQNLNETAGASGHQKLRVCETCGAMLSVLDSDKRLADHFGGKLHLGYNELRNLLGKMAEERMTGRQQQFPPQQNGPPPGISGANALGPASGTNNAPHNAPSGPRPNPPSFAPSGPSAGVGRRGPSPGPHTPLDGPKVPPLDEMPAVGHGDKVKREAGELVEDIKEERDRSSHGHGDHDRKSRDRYSEREDRDRYGDRERSDRDRSDRDRGDRSDRDRERDRKDDRYREDRYEKSSKYDDKERSSSHRDGHRDRDRRYDDDRERRRDRERSRSPSKRRLV